MPKIAIVRIVGESVGDWDDQQYVLDMVLSKITDWDEVDGETYEKIRKAMIYLKLYEQGYRLIERPHFDKFVLTTVKAFDEWVTKEDKRKADEAAEKAARKAARDQAKLLKQAKSEKQLIEELAKKHGLKVAPAK